MAPPPVAGEPPTLLGVPQTGATLSASPGTWTSLPAPTVAFQWQRCTDTSASDCVAIPNATGTTYTVTAADVGRTVRVVEAGTSNARTAFSASTAVPVGG
jgi:hypothetical protein